MSEVKKVPEIRFAGFAEPWEQRKFADVVQIERGGSPRPIEDFITDSPNGLNWVKIGDAPAQGHYIIKTADKIRPEGLSKTREVHPGDLILSNSMSFGKPYIMGIDGCIHDGWLLIRDTNSTFDLTFLCHLLGTPQMLDQYRSLAAGSAVNNLNKELVGNTVVAIPKIDEQRALGQYLERLDNLITLHQNKHEKLVALKKAMLEKMFPKNGSNVPEVRFAGFTDPWEQRKVGDITIESSEYANLEAGYPLLTSSRAGLMYQNEYRGNLTTNSKETLFSVVPIGACTYRHMSDDDVFHLNVNALEKGLVSREYPVFFASEGTRLDFIVQYINSSVSFRAFCAEQKKGGTRTRLYYNALCEFKMMVPSQREQDAIADFFLKLDNLITFQQRKSESLKHIKAALLQKMFV